MVSDVEIIQYDNEWKRAESQVIRESSLTIYFNGKPLINLLCTNNSREFLAVGFLTNERFIEPEGIKTIKNITLANDTIYIDADAAFCNDPPSNGLKTITSGLGKGITFEKNKGCLKPISLSSLKISPYQVFQLMKKLAERSSLYKLTHGVHNAAVCSPDDLEIFQFDLGRHNAIDKLYGQCLLENIPLMEKIIVTSGRVSSEILTKTVLMGSPILISRSAPTDRAIKLAEDTGLTLIARVRENKMSVYSHPERVIFDQPVKK
ncbi:formate dehydrogenase accessory sulfurtransferase FdhD [bacterium]|nr:formate dehydrogenase accessory sulfurtransferase FdhD [bacterium]